MSKTLQYYSLLCRVVRYSYIYCLTIFIIGSHSEIYFFRNILPSYKSFIHLLVSHGIVLTIKKLWLVELDDISITNMIFNFKVSWSAWLWIHEEFIFHPSLSSRHRVSKNFHVLVSSFSQTLQRDSIKIAIKQLGIREIGRAKFRRLCLSPFLSA